MSDAGEVRWDGPTLAGMFRPVRRLTIRLLDAASDAQLRWTPEGLTNHALWRTGHCLWVMDDVLIKPVTGRSELPGGWAATFEMDGRPPNEIDAWPERSALRDALIAQEARVVALLVRGAAERLMQPYGDWLSVGDFVVHGIQDEAMHQGETYLSLKMQGVNIGYR
ncbi:MAG: DinB family protein [Planctomycetota bacterium]